MYASIPKSLQKIVRSGRSELATLHQIEYAAHFLLTLIVLPTAHG